MSDTCKSKWAEGLADPAQRDRTEKIIDIILMRSCEFVCTINVQQETVNFRFMSEEMQRIAPHWKTDVDQPFDENMRIPLSELVRDDFRDEMLRTFHIPYFVEQLHQHSPYISTFDLLTPDGHTLRKQVQYYWIDESQEEILCIQTDISVAYEKELYNEQLRYEANTDPLTALPNRRGIRAILDDLEEQSLEYQMPFTIAMCDIDFFKRVNDTYGHDAGDIVLQSIAEHINDFLIGRGHVGRMGGEEFLIALNDCGAEQGRELIDELRESIAHLTIPAGRQGISITMTFGVAEYDPKTGVHEAITRADEQLYYGKEHGRNQVN